MSHSEMPSTPANQLMPSDSIHDCELRFWNVPSVASKFHRR